MSKGRKDQFEDQLRDLQKDISNLSQKLSIPPTTINASRFSSRDTTAVDVEATLQDINKSFNSSTSKTLGQVDKGEKLAQLMQEAHVAKREREDAFYRLEQMRAENEEMRKSLQDAVRIKSDYEHLKQDYESIRVSLESSERIRKQQKELINLLQRSHSIGAVVSDTGSIMSFNSISSIGEAPANTSSRRAADLSSASLAAENREWLNKSMNFPSAPPTSGNGSASAPRSSRRRSSVNAGAAQSESSSITALGHASSRPSSAGHEVSVARTVTMPRSVSQSSTPSTASRTKKSSHGAGAKLRRRKSTTDAPHRESSAEHQYSAAFNDSAASYSDIVSMNSSLVPNRHREALTSNAHVNLSAYGIESVSNYQIPVRQPLDSFNTSLRGGSLIGSHSNGSGSMYDGQQVSGYVPGNYVPGLATPTLAAHISQQQGLQQQHQQQQDVARLGRPPRHPSLMPSALAPPVRSATPVQVHQVPSVRKEMANSNSADPNSVYQPAVLAAEHAIPTAKSAKRNASTKSKSKKTSTASTPGTPHSAFVRRIPSVSPARATIKSPYSAENKIHTQVPQSRTPKQQVPSRYASPAARPASAPAAVSHLSTFGVSKRML